MRPARHAKVRIKPVVWTTSDKGSHETILPNGHVASVVVQMHDPLPSVRFHLWISAVASEHECFEDVEIAVRKEIARQVQAFIADEVIPL